jgi:hypothetical protein
MFAGGGSLSIAANARLAPHGAALVKEKLKKMVSDHCHCVKQDLEKRLGSIILP